MDEDDLDADFNFEDLEPPGESSSEDDMSETLEGHSYLNDPWELPIENASNSSSSDGSKCDDGPEHEVLKKPKSKHKWFVIKELGKREMGFGKSSWSNFKNRYYGSLHVVQRLELMYKMEEHTGCVNAICFNASGTRLISGSDDRNAVIWDWMLGKPACKFVTGHSGNVFQCKFLGGDENIVTSSRDGQIRLALMGHSGIYETKLLAAHSLPCHKLSPLPGSRSTFLSAGEDALVMCIDIRQPRANRLIYVKENGKKISLYSIHASPATGNEFCLTGADHYVRIYDRRKLPSRSGVAPIKYSPSNVKASSLHYVTCAVFNYNGTEVIGSYNDDDIYLFNAKSPSGSDSIHHYQGHRNSQTVKGVNFFGPTSEYIVSGSDCGYIYIWDKETEGIVQFLRGDEEGIINYLEPHPHVPILATCGLDADVKIWIPSCEHDPPMLNLKKTLKMNRDNRESRYDTQRTSFLNETLLRLWSQLSRNSFVRQVVIPRHLESGIRSDIIARHARSSSSNSSSSHSDNEEDDDDDDVS